jgi:hypothetical protein
MKRLGALFALGLARMLEYLVSRTLPRGRCAPPPPISRAESAPFTGDHRYVLGCLEHVEHHYTAHTPAPRIPRRNGNIVISTFLPLSYAEYERLVYAILTEGYGVAEERP